MKTKVIYKPKGRAEEYSDWALNLYNGCNFGCTYCSAPLVLKKDKELFHNDIKERDNLSSLARRHAIQAPKLSGC